MAETMGKIIRRLRNERGMTQEELAECVGVTAQAVSKWENDLGMPDISQIVPLSGTFGVHTDVLFGLETQRVDAAVKKAAVAEKENSLDADQCVELWKDLLRQYPRSGAVRFRLAGSLLKRSDYGKAAEQYERILDESTDEELRLKSLNLLCFCYHNLRDTENAIRIAELCPPVHISRETLLAKIDGYEKRNEINRDLMTYCLYEICWCVRRMEYKNKKERLAALNAAIRMLELFTDKKKLNSDHIYLDLKDEYEKAAE